MVKGRDDFVIAFRSAVLNKKDKQRFSLLTLIFLSIFVIILSNFDLKVIRMIKFGINEVVYRSSYLISIPENKIQKINNQYQQNLILQMTIVLMKKKLKQLMKNAVECLFLKRRNE